MRKIFLITILFITPFVSFANIENVGIIKGIWFSRAQFFDGDMIRIYTAVQNNSGADVEGEIEFFDNNTLIGKKNFSALNARIIESWIDTQVHSGEHTFSVKITRVMKSTTKQNTPIEAESISSDRVIVVKLDTDGDDIPDDLDNDDDGDGFSDEEEKTFGSDPLDNKSIPQQEKHRDDERGLSPVAELKGEVSQEQLLEQSPEIVQKLAENNDVVKSLAVHISDLQNRSKDFVKKERIKIEHSKDNVLSPDKKESREEGQKNPSNSFSTKARTFLSYLQPLYIGILSLLSWLFSIWWFMVLLLFLGIYLFLKLLFKIFGGKTYS